jgi:hypothetical protein
MLQTIAFLIFVLPALMIKEAWAMATKNMTKEDKKRWLWRVPYILLAILIFFSIILLMKGYRW